MIEPADVVVTRFTSPSWSSVLVYAGALVTTTGGPVSHAAVIARELAIPDVIGDMTAFAPLTTGMKSPSIPSTRPSSASVWRRFPPGTDLGETHRRGNNTRLPGVGKRSCGRPGRR